MSKLILKNPIIYTGYENQKLEGYDILIVDEKINKIDKDIVDNDAEVIDCTNKFVTPGLINLHAHLFGSGKPSKNLGTSLSQKLIVGFVKKTLLGNFVIRKIVRKTARMELMGGVTTLRTSGDLRFSDVWLRNKHFKDCPTLIVPGPAITCNIGHGHGTFADTSDDLEELKALVRRNKEKGVDYIKTCTTGGIMDSSKKGDPGVVKITKDQLKAIVDEAHRLGLKVASHTESEAGVNLNVECGVDFTEHGSTFSDEIGRKMKDNNMIFTLTFSPSVAFVELPPEMTKCGELATYNSAVVTNNMVKCGKKAIEKGINVALGTDAGCPFAFQHLSYREMVYASKMVGVSSSKALELMTINNAKLLGLDNKVGSIEEGKIADILIMSNDPMVNIDNFYDLDFIIHNGKTFKQEKYYKYKNFEKIMIKFKVKSEYELVD